MNPMISFESTNSKFYLIPSFEFYIEYYKKLNLKKDWKNKVFGLYLEAKWFNSKIIIGTNKKIKKRTYADFIF